MSRGLDRLRGTHDIPEYAVALLIPLLGAALCFFSSDCSPSAVRWRKSLVKSRFSPPAAASAIIWVYVYIVMGHSSYLVYMLTTRSVLSTALIVYLIQCLLNHFYIIVLFGLQRIDLALFMMIPLWFTTALTVLLFFEVSPQAGALMASVFLWVTIHVYLNFILYISNDVYTDEDMATESSPSSGKMKTS